MELAGAHLLYSISLKRTGVYLTAAPLDGARLLRCAKSLPKREAVAHVCLQTEAALATLPLFTSLHIAGEFFPRPRFPGGPVWVISAVEATTAAALLLVVGQAGLFVPGSAPNQAFKPGRLRRKKGASVDIHARMQQSDGIGS